MTQAKYGVDIAIRRSDDLDRKMIEWMRDECEVRSVIQGAPSAPCIDEGALRVLDIGCGGGGQSVRLAKEGGCVLGVDVGDYGRVFEKLREEYDLSAKQLRFAQGDVSCLKEVLSKEDIFDMVCFQRTLHYVRYETALTVLKELRRRVVSGGKLFISVTGIESDIGRSYGDAGKLVEDRFCCLNDSDAEVFSISQAVCLYTPEEFMVLLQEGGWEIDECWTSAFGNIKAICR